MVGCKVVESGVECKVLVGCKGMECKVVDCKAVESGVECKVQGGVQGDGVRSARLRWT